MAYFIGNVSSLVMEGDRTDTYLRDRLDDATAFCDKKNLPPELTRAILQHILYHVEHNYVFEEQCLIDSLPPNIQSQIHQRLAKSVLTQIDFFASFQRSTGMKETLGEIALKMRCISCNEGFKLFSEGDRAKEIYIQRTGESKCNYHDGSDLKTFRRGDVIGESAVFSPKRKTTVLCTTFCEFYVLPIREIVAVMEHEYPTTWNKRWSDIVHDLKVSNKQHGEKYVRSVDFKVMSQVDSAMPQERAMKQQIGLNSSANGATGTMMDGAENGDTALIPNGVQENAINSEASPSTPDVAGPPTTKKKTSINIPFLTRRSSLSRNDQIITMGLLPVYCTPCTMHLITF